MISEQQCDHIKLVNIFTHHIPCAVAVASRQKAGFRLKHVDFVEHGSGPLHESLLFTGDLPASAVPGVRKQQLSFDDRDSHSFPDDHDIPWGIAPLDQRHASNAHSALLSSALSEQTLERDVSRLMLSSTAYGNNAKMEYFPPLKMHALPLKQ